MTPSETLADLRSRGLNIWVERRELRFKAEAGLLPSQLMEALRQHHNDILKLLVLESLVAKQETFDQWYRNCIFGGGRCPMDPPVTCVACIEEAPPDGGVQASFLPLAQDRRH